MKTGFFFSLLLVLFAIVLIERIYAQEPQDANVSSGISLREVSGIVLDSTGSAVAGAIINLDSKVDSLVSVSNSDGVFIFQQVKSATFYITIKSLGFKPITQSILQNDAVPKVVLDPVILSVDGKMLSEVNINAEPSITYKTDTVEYRATDYKVREYAAVDELLKKMEGMEVGRNGSLTYMGQPVTGARLNGKDFIGGNIVSTIQNLPAEIVSKIQIINDYGDEAARTGIKEGGHEKVLNITTKEERSIGNMFRLKGGAGNNDRYQGQLFGAHINANQTIGLNADLTNSVNGIARSENNSETDYSRGSGGTSNVFNPTVSYSDSWNEKLNVELSYSYNKDHLNFINKSKQQQFSTQGTTLFDNNDDEIIDNEGHALNLSLEYNINKSNFLRINPKLSYKTLTSVFNSSSISTGLLHQDQNGLNFTTGSEPNIGGSVFFQHFFEKKNRSFTISASGDVNDYDNETEQNIDIMYYIDDSERVVIDSLIHRRLTDKNLTENYRVSTTFTEPIGKSASLQMNGQVNVRTYDNSKVVSNVISPNLFMPIDSLNNTYTSSFKEFVLALSYRFTKEKYAFSVGMNAVPTVLTSKGSPIVSNRTSFNLTPVGWLRYHWSHQHQIQIHYSGSPVEPIFSQFQPVRDVSDPQNPIVGNPHLKTSFINTVDATYSNYIANSRFNYSINIRSMFIKDKVAQNIVMINDDYNSLKYETRFVNMDGDYSLNANYNLSKQFSNQKYSLSLNGTINNIHSLSMSDGLRNLTSIWRFDERFGLKIEPSSWLEINPYLSYEVLKSTTSVPLHQKFKTEMFAFNIDGKIYLPKEFHIGYYASKKYVTGFDANIKQDPFIINVYFEKRFRNKIGASLKVEAFDLLNQNNFINRIITENSIIDTKTNTLSRYFMLTFSMNLQKWSGSPQRNGEPILRKGDGSFTY